MNTLLLLKKLVSIQSVFPCEQELSLFISEYLRNIGFIVKNKGTDKHRQNIIASFGNSDAYLGFYGHMDTVAPDSGYIRDPYDILVKGDRVYGLGTADMKGGITAILKFAEFAVQQNLPVKIIFGVDEENISKGAHDLVTSGKMNDISFLISAESGQVKELSSKYSICFGRKGRILFHLKTFGKKSHAAEDIGINAIDEMARLISHMKKLAFPSHDKLGDTKLVVHSITGDTDSFSVPDSCMCTFSALTNSYTTAYDVQKAVKKLAENLHVSVSIEQVQRETPYGESYEVDIRNIFLRKAQEEIFDKDHQKPIYTASVADENIFANKLHIPVISLGPIGQGDHTKDEWVSFTSINDTIDVYKKMLVLFTK